MEEAILLAWNPKCWSFEKFYPYLDFFMQNGFCEIEWKCHRRYDLIGLRCYLVKLGSKQDKGIIGSGIIVNNSNKSESDDTEPIVKGKRKHFVKVVFHYLNLKPLIDESELKRPPFAIFKNWFPQCSGITLPPDVHQLLLMKFNEKLKVNSNESIFYLKTFEEGKIQVVKITHPERNSRAKEECLRIHGYKCKVCNKSLQELYGDIGNEIIEVHHLNPISFTKEKHIVNPKEDLVPLCPNCHRLIHTKTPPYTVQELTEIISYKKNI